MAKSKGAGAGDGDRTRNMQPCSDCQAVRDACPHCGPSGDVTANTSSCSANSSANTRYVPVLLLASGKYTGGNFSENGNLRNFSRGFESSAIFFVYLERIRALHPIETPAGHCLSRETRKLGSIVNLPNYERKPQQFFCAKSIHILANKMRY